MSSSRLSRSHVSWRAPGPVPHIPPTQPCPIISIPICTLRRRILPLLEESYERRHDRGGVAQSLDGGVGPLLEVVVVPRHVEGREGGAAALHGAGDGGRRQGHPEPAVRRQGALDGVRDGGRYGRRAGAKGGQGLWVLKSREAGGRRDPGAERQVIGRGEGGPWKAKGLVRLGTLFRRASRELYYL